MSLVRVLILVAALLACSVKGDSLQQESSAGNQPVPNLYPVTINDKCGFIDESGNLKFMLPDDIYNTGRFSEGLAVVGGRFQKIYGRWGFVDHTGKIVVETKFSLAKIFSEGLAAVIVSEEMGSAAGKIGYIDKTGTFVIQPQFKQGGVVIDYAFSEGLAAVPSGSHYWGYIDKTGKFVIEGLFTEAFPFSEGRALVGIAESPGSSSHNFQPPNHLPVSWPALALGVKTSPSWKLSKLTKPANPTTMSKKSSRGTKQSTATSIERVSLSGSLRIRKTDFWT